MWCDVGINMLSDLFYSFLVSAVIYAIFRFNRRRKLHKFFGINKSKKLTIFTSNLIVERFGSSGHDGKRYSFKGEAIPNQESRAAAQLQTLFNYFLPSQLDKPGLLSKLLISDIEVNVIPAPIDDDMIEQSATIISLGFPPYNSISRFIESSLNPPAKLDYIPVDGDHNIHHSENSSTENTEVTESDNAANIVVPSGNPLPIGVEFPLRVNVGADSLAYIVESSGSSVPQTSDGEYQQIQSVIRVPEKPPFTDLSVGFVQKVFDNQNKRCYFYIAGLSEKSTAGCAYYLINNWNDLSRDYKKDTPFYVLLKVSNSNNRISQVILKS